MLFVSSTLGLRAAEAAVAKSKLATGAAVRILARARSDSWESKLKLYHSLVTSVLLYAAPIWGLRYTDTLEKAQSDYFKRLLLLPTNTTNCALRLELGIAKIALWVLKLAWAWVIKLLAMPDHRLPRRCFNRPLLAFRRGNGRGSDSKYNWIAQMDSFLSKIELSHMWNSLDAAYWSSMQEQALRAYENYLKAGDLANFATSSSCQLAIPRSLSSKPAAYLTQRVPFAMVRVLAQIRLANSRRCLIVDGRVAHSLDPNQLCTLCNRLELETAAHLFLSCPIYSHLREEFLSTPALLRDPPDMDSLLTLLDRSDSMAIGGVFKFCCNAMRLRAFILNE